MKYMCLLFSVAIFFLNSCIRETETNPLSISVDVEKKNNNVSFFDLFDSVEVIYLETNQDCMINQPTRSIYQEGAYYIFDRPQKAIFVFDNTGNFLFKIHNVGNGPGEYHQLVDFEINNFTNSIDLLTPFGQVLKYDLSSGVFLYSYQLPESVRAVHFFKSISPETTVFYQKFENRKLLFYSLKEQTIVSEQHELPYYVSRYLPRAFNWHPFHRVNGSLRLFEDFSRTIYDLEQDTITPYLSWDFGKYNFNYGSLKVNMDPQYYEDYLNDNSLIHILSTYIENDSIIITQFFWHKSFYSLIYKKGEEEYLLMDGFTEGVKFPSYPFLQEEGLCAVVQPWHIGAFLPEEIIKSMGIPKCLNTECNPVILKYNFLNSSHSLF
ncbi:MAG: 6-bladed beta-propeller [Bacteroidales bacterium]